MRALNILHVKDMASVAHVFSKQQRIQGHHSRVIILGRFDPFRISSYYPNHTTVVRSSVIQFYLKALWMSRHADIVHLHDIARRLSFWRRMYTKKPLILHYHGSQARDTPFEIRARWERHADVILLSTSDLLDHRYLKPPTYVPNPVDTDLFTPRDIPRNNRGLVLMKNDQSRHDTLSLLKEHGFGDIDWECRERGSTLVHCGVRNTLYSNMPDYLSSYEWYGDINILHGKLYPSKSMTGLQAMSLGVKTIGSHFEVHDALPEQHRMAHAAKKLDSIYAAALETKQRT